jgi:uncharacterized protein with LGFP repeats
VTAQRGRFGAAISRAVILAAMTAAVAVLLTPTAKASPDSDADDAITAAWKDAGGPTSTLGDKQGAVYPVGDGFAQDFANGKMFFTPPTGARAIFGPILDKYESLGGPAGSDLGFPTINEVPGLAGPDSRVSTFSAGDKPVIFWTPDHGAFVVRGPMNAAWDKLGSSGGALGVPTGDETDDGEVTAQTFSGGKVSWNRLTKTFSTAPPELAAQLTGVQVPIDPTAAINSAWRATGGAGGALGAKQGDQYPIGSDGVAQNFAHGKIFFSPATGANAVESDILAKYESVGGPVGSDLGFPTANEADGGLTNSRISTFNAADKPVIFWTRGHGAFVLRGPMKTAWDKLGGAKGKLGAPVGDQTVDGDTVTQDFTGGKVSWDRTKNTYTTEPPNLASLLSGVQVPGKNQPSRPVSSGAKAWAGHWWWLLVAVPVLLLLGTLTVLALRRPGRRRATQADTASDETAPAAEEDAALEARDEAVEAVPDTTAPWPEDFADDEVTSQLRQQYRDPQGVRPTPGAPEEPEWPRRPGAAGLGAPTDAASADEATPDFYQDADENPDAVDTAPTRIPTAVELSGGRHAAAVPAADGTVEPSERPARGAAQLAIHLPLDDPYEVPDGYPVKASASYGLYYTPGDALYDDTLAEIWFVSEEAAQSNGFSKPR